MAFGSGGTLGTGTSSTSSSSFSFNTATNALAAGDFALLVVVTDNIQTATGNSSDHTGVTGSGISAEKIGEYTNGQSAAGAGVTTSAWLLKATAAVGTGTAITINLSGAVVDKTCSAWKFTKGAGLSVRLCPDPATNPVGNSVDASNGFGSVNLGTLASKARLYVRALGKEANSTTALTVSSGFTAITAQRSRNNASAVLVRGEFRINTSTGETSNPTMAVAGDTAGLFFALEEYDPKPVITVQPTNQAALEDGSATFTYTDSGATSRQWQELISGGGGAAYIAGSVQRLTTGSNSINIPADAQSALLFLPWWHGGGSTPTLSCTALPDLNGANKVFTNGNPSPPYQAGRLRSRSTVTATGAQTLTISGQTDIFNGPAGFIVFLDGAVTVIDEDMASVGDTGDVTLSLDTAAGALVFVLDCDMDTATPPSNPGGWTSLDSFSNNSMVSRLRMLTATDAAGISTGSDANYETLIGYSVQGGGASWSDISGETTNSLTLSGLTLADSGRVFRGTSTNADGTTPTNQVTLTVTDGKLYLTALSTAPAEAPTSTNTKNIAAPSGIQAGHRELLLVGVGSTSGGAPVINAISGWTTKPEWQSGALSIGGGTFALRLALFERVADGPGSTVVATSTVAGYWGWHRTAWGNANTDFIANVDFGDVASTTAPVLPAMTPSKSNAVLLDWQVLGVLASITEAAGMTELSENTDHAIGLYMKQLLDTTTVGARTYSYSPAADAGFAVVELHSLISEGSGGSMVSSTSLALAIQTARSAAASVVVPVQTRAQQSASLAMAVRATGSAQADLAAAVQQAQAASALVAMAVRDSRADSADFSLAVQAVDAATADLALAVQQAREAITGVDLQVQAASLVSASIRALVQAGQSASVALEVLVQKARAASTDLAAAIMVARSAGADVSTAVQRPEAADLGVRLAIEISRAGELGVDLQVQDGFSHAVSASTAVQLLQGASASLSAAVNRMASASTSLAGAVSARRFIDAEVDLVVQILRKGSVGVSAFVVIAGQLMRWDGAAWLPVELKRFDGADWVDTELRRWDGADWV